MATYLICTWFTSLLVSSGDTFHKYNSKVQTGKTIRISLVVVSQLFLSATEGVGGYSRHHSPTGRFSNIAKTLKMG